MKKIVVLILLIIINCFANGENIKLWSGENGKVVKVLLKEADSRYGKIVFLKNGDIFFERACHSILVSINTTKEKTFDEVLIEGGLLASYYKEKSILFNDDFSGLLEFNIEKGTVRKIGNLNTYDVDEIFYNKFNDTIIFTNIDNYKVYDIKRKKIIKEGKRDAKQVMDICFSPDGKYIIMGNNGGEVLIRDSKTDKTEKKIELNGSSYIMKYTPDGKSLVCGDVDGNIYYIDAVTKKVVKKFKAHKGVVMTIDFNSDGTKMVTGSGYSSEMKTTDDRVKVWNVSDGKQLFEMKMDMNKENESAYGAAFTPDGKYIVTYPTYCRTIYEFGD